MSIAVGATLQVSSNCLHVVYVGECFKLSFFVLFLGVFVCVCVRVCVCVCVCVCDVSVWKA